MKNLRKRIEEQVKKLSRKELERKYLQLLFKSVKSKKNKTAILNGTLGSMIPSNKRKKTNDTKISPKKLTRKEQYNKDLESLFWLKKRSIILERDNYKCRICGSTENLQVHHTKYSDGKRAWEYPNSTLITLCKDCHKKVHQDENNELNPYKKTLQ